MAKVGKDYFTNNEVLFVGYSSKKSGFNKGIYDAFTRNNIKVYPLNNKENAGYEIKVYKTLGELPKVPKCAYVLLNKENSAKIIKELSSVGVQKILFHSSKTVDPDTLSKCKEMGIETAVACPLMILGTGIHKIHGFFAGV